MYIGEFTAADGSENEPYGFDFRRDLSSGETISGAVFEIGVIDGTDATPASRLLGTPTIVGTEIRHRVAGLVPGVTYRLEAVASTNLGNAKSLWGRVACKS